MGLRLGCGWNNHVLWQAEKIFPSMHFKRMLLPCLLKGISLGQGPAAPGRICLEPGFPGFCPRGQICDPTLSQQVKTGWMNSPAALSPMDSGLLTRSLPFPYLRTQ